MQRLKNISYNLALALNVLLVFLLLFEAWLQVPGWLQVMGRMHPLVLHFPIVLLLLAASMQLPFMKKRDGQAQLFEALLLAGSVTASATALSGLLLSQEAGYNKEEIALHKWFGIGTALLSFAWYTWRRRVGNLRWAAWGMPLVAAIGLVVAGHSGAGITHGDGFLLAPVDNGAKAPTVAWDDAQVYRDMVQPILKEKCMGCHSTRKAKGALVMETEALLLKGGKNGKLWDTAATNLGLMMQRIHLPLQEKKHMPPAGKPQLNDEEVTVLTEWIRLGSPFGLRVADLPDSNALRTLAAARFSATAEEEYAFSEASAATIKKLNTANRVVFALAQGSPALVAEFYGPSLYNAQQLDELEAVKEQLISLSLNKMPVKDDELKTIASFKNLRHLNLGFTDITAAGLKHLSGLRYLKELTLSGTRLQAADLQLLASLPALKKLAAWNTEVKQGEQLAIEQRFRNCKILWGYSGDTLLMKLNAPIIQNEKQIIDGSTELLAKHYLPGVDLRYTLDGSEPDSVRSPQYKAGLTLDSAAVWKVKAFKPGWLSSDVAELMFFKNRFHADSVALRLPPAEAYKAKGGATLNDLEIGDKNFRSGKWLGFKDNRMEAMMFFDKPVNAGKVSINCLVDIASYIMPPQSVEVWGGSSPANLKLLAKLAPVQPSKEVPTYLQGYDVRFAPQLVSCIRVVAIPVVKLPEWHRGKGDKGWVFADEIFVN